MVQYQTDPSHLLPGEEWELGLSFSLHFPYWGLSLYSLYYSDPLDMTKALEEVLQKSSDPRETVHQALHRKINRESSPQDCFALLPFEILHDILLQLQSRDVLNLKLASAVFSETPLYQSFWASRFQRGFGFHSVFEAP